MWASMRGLVNLVSGLLNPALPPSLSIYFLNDFFNGLPRFLPLQASKMRYYHGNSPRF
jgi:hypothetical protein